MVSTEVRQMVPKRKRDTRSPFPRPLPHAGTDPLSPPQGWLPTFPRGSEVEPEPKAGRQDAEVPGSTPHPCPSFSGHPERRGQLSSLPPGNGKERKCRVCWEVLGRQVLS